MKAVLDPNVIISALLSPAGNPARVLVAWREGRFELVVSALLLAELERALAYPKLRRRIPREEAQRAVEWIGGSTTVVSDPDGPASTSSPDPGDDYLLALAERERAVLVSGDGDLLELPNQAAIMSPRDFLEVIERTS